MTTLLLVHGMWHGAWCWADVRARLSRPSVAVDLPMRSLAEDAETVRVALDSIDDEVVLVGHSYGGAVITALGPQPRVRRLVYLAAFLLDEGESVSRVAPELGIADTGLGAALRFSADRREVAIDPDLAPGLLYQRTDPAVAADAVARLRPVARSVFSDRPAALAWRRVPSTYVICTEDRTVAPALQRVMAARAGDAVEWRSDHSPQAGRPDDVAALLDNV
jgi:pimeloyl-ACP methyl ester carboxylesterase